MVAFTSCQVFVEESPGESETISIDEPTTIHDEKSFDDKTFDKKNFETVSRNKRATDYSSAEAYEDEEEEPAQGSGASENTYEDEVRYNLFVNPLKALFWNEISQQCIWLVL